MAIQVFVNYTPHPTFKLREEIGGNLANSRNIQNPAPFNNIDILEGLEGKTLHLDDGFFLLQKFQNLGNWKYSVELLEVSLQTTF